MQSKFYSLNILHILMILYISNENQTKESFQLKDLIKNDREFHLN